MKKIILAAAALLISAFLFGCGQGSDDSSNGGHKNKAPIFITTAPTVAEVGELYRYDLTVINPDGKAKNITPMINKDDTCNGILTSTKFAIGNFQYSFTPSAAQVGTQCVIGLTASDGKSKTDQNSTVSIGAEIAAPDFTSTASTTATEDILYTYDITAADDNAPPQPLTLTLGPIDTCGGTLTDNGDGTGNYSFTPSENEGGDICLLSLTVTDSSAVSVDQNSAVTVTEDNKAPYFTSTAPTTATEGILYTYSATVGDPDIPAQTLACSINGSDTCGGALAGCSYSFTPTEADGGTNCTVGLRVTDNGAPALFTDQNTTVAIAEANDLPTWPSAPNSIVVLLGATYNSVNGVAVDSDDFPAQTLTCSKVGADTCAGFDVTVTGSSTSPVSCNLSFTAGASPQTCGVDVQVDDGAGGIISGNIPISVKACRIYIDDSATGTNDGSSWTNAFTVLQTGVNAAALSTCDVWVAEGVYLRPVAGNGPVLTMANGIKMYGGFAGTETALSERGDSLDFPTYLDGENLSYHVVMGANNALLDGFYIVNGNANGASDYRGGGMYNNGKTNLTVNHCTFYGNSASASGTGSAWGGGMCNISSSPTITNCTFIGNSASGAMNTYGGGIHNNSSSPTITNCIFSGNSADSFGGGIYNFSSSPTITNCTFIENSASGGGGMYTDTSSPTITNCIFGGNSAEYGGGMESDESSPTIKNCTFSENSASDGGGMFNYYATPTITNCIMWGDFANEIRDMGLTATVTYSDIGQPGYAGGNGNINSNPLFKVGLFGSYYLQSTSPCINAGTGVPSGYGLQNTTTSTLLSSPDVGVVDMGYHYPVP